MNNHKKGPSGFLNLANLASFISLIFSAIFHAGSIYTGHNRLKALSAKCQFEAEGFDDYFDRAGSMLGERKADSILDSVIATRVSETPFDENTAIHVGAGTTLCYDVFTRQYFYSDIEKIKQTVANLNVRTTLNEFLCCLGLPYYGAIGEILGWVKWIDIYYCSCMTQDGRAVFVLYYHPEMLE